ncbi:hypothetical protein DE149_1219 [Micrococcus sp. KT16]|uniref:hypothetical protein n=1 Tax=Micrococcus sp. KT16 TaxID=2184005 RepID=UPI000DEBFC01|nr:hypothetical protein [Micrococcus sp. KT16]RBO83165.1 hypothetical protein DE149_1219 [Micrococcus sp. KT16]
MSTNSTAQQWDELARRARALAVESTELETAAGLREVIHQVYEMTKFDRPGGEGLDGKDGPERRGIGYIRDMAEDYHVRTMQNRRA